MKPSLGEDESLQVFQMVVPPVMTALSRVGKNPVIPKEIVENVDLDALLDGTTGKSIKPKLMVVRNGTKDSLKSSESSSGTKLRDGANKPQNLDGRGKLAGLKRGKLKGGTLGPPVPWGCEWRRDESGWNLWRCWSEKEVNTEQRVVRSRYAGYLSHEAWEVMKGYDYETFLSIIGQRFRRHGKR